jgi:hypothetical protein
MRMWVVIAVKSGVMPPLFKGAFGANRWIAS